MPEEQGGVTSSSLLAAAQEYDTQKEAGIEEPQVEVMQPEPKAEEPEETEQVAEDEAAPKADDVQNDKSSLTEQPEEVAPEEPKSKYAKNRKRLDDAWKSVNDDKEDNKRARVEIEAERAEIEKMREKVTADRGYRDEHGHTAKDYDDAAKDFIEEGDDKLAKASSKKAEEMRAKESDAVQNVQRNKNEEIRQEQIEMLKKEHPELSDSNSPLFKEVAALMATYPILQYDPYGVKTAVDVAFLRQKANRSDELEARVNELESVKSKLEKKTSVVGGFTGERLEGDKGFDDMSDNEQRDFLMRAAVEHDNAL
jgi:hypothetical protein